jgi:hypothetical protein
LVGEVSLSKVLALEVSCSNIIKLHCYICSSTTKLNTTKELKCKRSANTHTGTLGVLSQCCLDPLRLMFSILYSNWRIVKRQDRNFPSKVRSATNILLRFCLLFHIPICLSPFVNGVWKERVDRASIRFDESPLPYTSDRSGTTTRS